MFLKVFQHRFNGSVSFYRDWNTYRNGFGNLNGEFWLGNEKVHYITSQSDYMLEMNFKFTSGENGYFRYDPFRIGTEETQYKLEVLGEYTGSSGTHTDQLLSQDINFTTLFQLS